MNIASGATTTGLTKAINFGSNGATGSTTNINIGTGLVGTGTITIGTATNGTTNIAGPFQLAGSAVTSTAAKLNYLTSATGTTGTNTTNLVFSTSPQLTTPNIGVASGTSLAATGVLSTGANSGTNGQLTLYGSTSGSGILSVNVAAGAGILFQLPSSNGSNTNVLQTNGAGVTSWTTMPTSMTWPTGGAGIPNYNGSSAWGTSYTTTGSGSVIALQTSPVFSTSISTPSIVTASGALGITPAAGSNLNINLSTTGDFAVNTNQLYVDTSAGTVGIGTTAFLDSGNMLNVVTTNAASAQVNVQNQSNGTSASSDFVATADTGTNTTNYVNLGINSSTYSDSGYTIGGALSSYLYSNGGDLTVGTQTAAKVIKFHTGGTLAANLRATISDTGLAVAGIMSAANDTLTSGTLLNLTSNGTAALTGQKGINVALSGANGTGAQTTYSAYLSNAHSGTSVNVGLYTTATGGSTNLGLNVDGGQTLLGGTTLTAGTLAKLNIVSTMSSNGSSTAVAGIQGAYTFTNGGNSGYVQVGNRFDFYNTPTTNSNTMAGEIIRTTDNTSLANLVRGIEVTSNAGSNTAGTNTGIRTTGATFGLQAFTNGLAGAVSTPAAIYAENTGTTAGDILRLYSTSVTSAPTFADFYQNTSAFTGTGLLMNFAAGSGSYTGNYIDLQSNSTSVFKVNSNGVPSVGLGSTGSTNAVCSSLANNTAPTAKVAYELRDCNAAPAADYAEMYPVDTDITYGDIVTVGTEKVMTYDTTDGNIDWNKEKGYVSKLIKSNSPYQSNTIGIVSNNYGDFSSTGNNIKKENNPMPVALSGRVPVKISNNSEPIKFGDYLTTSSDPGMATKATKAGFAIGKALEDWNPGEGKDTVMVFVEEGYYDGATSFAATTGTDDTKENVKPFVDPNSALTTIINTPVYTFNLKSGTGAEDSTNYVGVMASEAPWAIGSDGNSINTTNALGYTILGMQAINKKINDLTTTVTNNLAQQTATNEATLATIQELNLKISDLSSLDTTSSTSLGSLIKNFLGDVSNGVVDFFANRVHTKQLCVGDASGETCITKGQLDSLLAATGTATTNTTSTTNTNSGNTNTNNPGNTNTNTTPTNTDLPVITLNGNATVTLNVGDTYTEAGATVKDNVDTYVAVDISGTVDTTTAGMYTIKYDAKDTAGNTAVEVTRTVIVNAITPTIPDAPTAPATVDTTPTVSSTTATISDGATASTDSTGN
jgi:hypothetical protein